MRPRLPIVLACLLALALAACGSERPAFYEALAAHTKRNPRTPLY